MKKYRLVPEAELRHYLEAWLKLQALEHGGVDNWEWYGYSLRDFLENWAKETGRDPEDEDLDFDEIVNEDIEEYLSYEG